MMVMELINFLMSAQKRSGVGAPLEDPEDEGHDMHGHSMRVLLSAEAGRLERCLSKLYLSRTCQCFYIVLALICSLMAVVMILDKQIVHSSTSFLIAELIVNVIIFTDFILKVRLAGIRRFLKTWTNILDCIVVLGCILTFFIYLSSKSWDLIYLEDLTEDILFLSWSVLQFYRIIIFLKN